MISTIGMARDSTSFLERYRRVGMVMAKSRSKRIEIKKGGPEVESP
jgi:hypothetical protein